MQSSAGVEVSSRKEHHHEHPRTLQRHGLRPGAGGPQRGRCLACRPRFRQGAVHRRRMARRRRRQDLRRAGAVDRQAARQGQRCRRRRCRRRGRRRPQGACRNGAPPPATSAPRCSTPSAAPCSATSGCSPCWNRSTTASRSAKAATSTCRWRSAISSIMPAGRRRWTANSPATGRPASSARSSRGISRC